MASKVHEPVQARAVRTRLRLLSAARHCFARNGFHGTKMDAVARRARVNKQRIYAYFRSKQALFATVLRAAYEEVIAADAVFLTLPDTEIPHLAERLLRHYLRFHEEHPHFWRLLSWANLEGGRQVAALAEIRQPSFQHLRMLYQRGQGQGHYCPEVSFEAFMLTISAVAFFYHANQRTMSGALALDLAAGATRERLTGEMLRLLGGDGG